MKDVNDDLFFFWIFKKLINKWFVIFVLDDKLFLKIRFREKNVSIVNRIFYY